MALVEASSASRAVCRECGSAIVIGEPRFGREEGAVDARRLRWRHLICAAQNLPDALLHALELGGWRSVPEEDHDELRGLINRARAARRRPTSARSVSDSAPGPRAARSNSVMAAAAVLEPAHQTRSLPPEQARAWVFADALQAQGDPRGELLALELAAEHTDDPLQARALQRERNRCWKAFAPQLRPSGVLHLRWVGGFLLAGYPKEQHELHRLLASRAASSLTRIRVDFCTREELHRLVGAATTHRRPLAVVELPHSRSNDLSPLASLPELALLRVGDRFDPRVLAQLRRLRGLSLLGDDQVGLAELAPIAESLEVLELCEVPAARVDGLGRQLPALEQLRLTRARIEGAPEFLRGATRLRSLRLPDSPLSSLGPIAGLPALRELELVPGKLRLVAELEPLATLERLALSGSKVGELEPLAALVACEHLALSSTRATDLNALVGLPRLRSLVIEGGDMRRVSGLAALTELEQLRLARLANLDLDALAGFARLHTLVLDPGDRRPRSLDTLAQLPALRRLSAPVELLAALDGRPPILAAVEVLELTGDATPCAKLRAPAPAQAAAPGPRARAARSPRRGPAGARDLRRSDPSGSARSTGSL